MDALQRVNEGPVQYVEDDESHRKDNSGLFINPVGHFLRRHRRPSGWSGGSRSAVGNRNSRYAFFAAYQVVLTLSGYHWNAQIRWKTLK